MGSHNGKETNVVLYSTVTIEEGVHLKGCTAGYLCLLFMFNFHEKCKRKLSKIITQRNTTAFVPPVHYSVASVQALPCS